MMGIAGFIAEITHSAKLNSCLRVKVLALTEKSTCSIFRFAKSWKKLIDRFCINVIQIHAVELS